MVLEAGLAGGSPLYYWVMVFVAGLTALYTLRMVWLVFFGEPRSDYHAHPTGLAMKIALAPLALGALVSWLAIGPFSRLLSGSLPYHQIELVGLGAMFRAVVSWSTLIPLAVIAVGILCWVFREQLSGVARALNWLRWTAEHSFGFEAINTGVVNAAQASAEGLRVTQTGILSWNLLAIVGTVILFFALFAIGA